MNPFLMAVPCQELAELDQIYSRRFDARLTYDNDVGRL
jgi:hypothetical protein